MHHIVTHKLREKAAGRDGDAIVVIDPHRDLVDALLRHVPAEIADKVRLIDLADEEREELHTRQRVRRLKAVANMIHSAATLARPRSRNLRALCCSLMIPKTGSTSCFLSL